LTPEQRVERARSLLSTALGLALVKNGWNLHATPGEFHLDHGDEKLDPHKLVREISDGVISQQSWTAKCNALGIGEILLAVPVESIGVAKQEALPLG
jgi:hypothetical protein